MSAYHIQPIAPRIFPGTPEQGLPYDAAMEGLKFAVLDVETTTGDPTTGRVMEVAVLALDGVEERLRWDTLVHPGTPIPAFAQRLTGIDQRMVADAPRFLEIVGSLHTITEGRILVAHNIRFDLTALQHEFARTGIPFARHTFCTERASRRLVPGLSHYNLRSLCRYFGIEQGTAHRAPADAAATAGLLVKLLQEFGSERVLEGVVPMRTAKVA